jgi:hypothetical protein
MLCQIDLRERCTSHGAITFADDLHEPDACAACPLSASDADRA